MGLFPTLAPYLLPHVVPTLHARFIDAVMSGQAGDPSFRRGADLPHELTRAHERIER